MLLALKMILKALTKLGKWCKNNLRLSIEIVLVASLAFAGYLYNKKKEEVNQIKQEAGQLADGLRQQITIRDNKIEILTRQGTKVEYRNVYVPPEGYIIIQQKELASIKAEYASLIKRWQEATSPEARAAIEAEIRKKIAEESNSIVVTVKDKGFTLRPGIGLAWANQGIKPRADVKFFFFKRWSAITGGSPNGLDIGVSRHIDDLLIWFHPQNVEVFGAYNYLRFNNSASQGTVGLRINL